MKAITPTMDMIHPLFSLISVVKNNGGGLRYTLDSIYEQTIDTRLVQTIIIDGSDTENLQHIVNAYTVDIYSAGPDNGIYDAMNKGVQYASGTWTLFLNSGDVFVSCDVLEHIAAKILQVQNAVVKHPYKVICAPVIEVVSGRAVVLSTTSIHKMPLHMPASHQGMVFETSILQQYTFNTAYRICADLELLARILQDGHHILYHHDPITCVDGIGISNIRWKETLSERMRVQRTYYPGIRQYLRMFAYIGATVLKKIARKVLPISLILFIRSKIHKQAAQNTAHQ